MIRRWIYAGLRRLFGLSISRETHRCPERSPQPFYDLPYTHMVGLVISFWWAYQFMDTLPNKQTPTNQVSITKTKQNDYKIIKLTDSWHYLLTHLLRSVCMLCVAGWTIIFQPRLLLTYRRIKTERQPASKWIRSRGRPILFKTKPER